MPKIKIIEAGPIQVDGLLVAQTGEKLSFLGANPVVRPVGATQAAVSVVPIAVAAGANPTKAEYDAMLVRLNALLVLTDKIRTDLVALGLIKGAA